MVEGRRCCFEKARKSRKSSRKGNVITSVEEAARSNTEFVATEPFTGTRQRNIDPILMEFVPFKSATFFAV
jgi:hypothetical protein